MTSTLIIAALNTVVVALTARQRFNAARPESSNDYMLKRWFIIVMAAIIVLSIILFIVGRIQRRQGK